MDVSTTAAPDPSTDFADFLPRMTIDLDNVTTHAASLPPKSDLSFHRTLDKELGKKLDDGSRRLLSMAQELLELVDPTTTPKTKSWVDASEELSERYKRNVVPTVDGLLEQTDSIIDELRGVKKPAAIHVKPELEKLAGQKLPGPFSATVMPSERESAQMRRPQLDFPDVIDNNADLSVPNLPVKHHAMVPLGYTPPLDYVIDPSPAKAKAQLESARQTRRHPYYYEMNHIPYPSSMFQSAPVIKPAPIETVQPIWVDTPEQLSEMVEELKLAKEIGVDLEHHHTFSFHGFTCLMQISTRDKDWVVDTLALRGALREHKLGGVFADPSIIKVFHGAFRDIEWLQKDFGIYVVNLFDTHEAAVVLDISPRGLASLLALYCGYLTDKKYQMADWRVRPLSAEMMRYAQSDTHFILSIYDNLRNALLDMSRQPSPAAGEAETSKPSAETNPQRAMREVLDRSAAIALTTWNPQPYDPKEAFTPFRKEFTDHLSVDPAIRARFERIYAWANSIARKEDVAQFLVLRRMMIARLARSPPSTIQGLRAVLGRRNEIAQTHIYALQQVLQNPQRAPSANIGNTSPREGTNAKATTRSAPIATSTTGPVVDSSWPEIMDDLFFQEPSTTVSESRKTDSQLFGKTKVVPTPKTAAPYKRKAESSLFGPVKNTKTELAESSDASNPALLDIMEDIAAEMAPKPAPAPVADTTVDKTLSDPETVPFVPATERAVSTAHDMLFSSKSTEVPAAQEAESKENAKSKAKAMDEPEIIPVKATGSKRKERRARKAEASAASQSTPNGVAGTSGDHDVDMMEDAKAKDATAEDANQEVGTNPAVMESPETAPEASTTTKKARKRKTAPAAAGGEDGSAEGSKVKGAKSKKKKTAPEDVPDFDYSTAPNLLDDPKAALAASESKGKKAKKERTKKDKKDKPPAISGTTFGKVPQDMSQPKGGNRSQTFN